MALQFERFAEEANTFLRKLAGELGYPNDTERASRVLRSVLGAVREQLTAEESLQLIAQLPFFLKALYVNDWSSKTLYKKPIKDYDKFVVRIRELHGRTHNHDYKTDEEISKSVSTVLAQLSRYVSDGELKDIKAILPKELKPMLDEALA